MGCNSHISVEILGRWINSKQWETWALDLPESRDYYLYEAMAGVRGEEEKAVVLPRGVPADASRAVKYWVERAGEDGHSHSWLYPAEFNKALKQSGLGDGAQYETAKEWVALDSVLKGLGQVYGEESVRLVFFFDN